MILKHFLIINLIILFTSCGNKEDIDLLVYNARIYTVDSSFSIAEAMAISGGKILAIGSTDSLNKVYNAKEKLDAGGKFIYPGFIDAHAHFLGYGRSLQTVNLIGTKSWEEVVQRCVDFAKENPEGWITGRGWDQNDWAVQSFPDKKALDEAFPDRPVLITRVDGHAAVANARALELAGVEPGEKIEGGDYELKNGRLTGILIDNAIDKVSNSMPAPDKKANSDAFLDAQNNCFAVGLTTIADCGLDANEVDLIHELHRSGELKMRIYAMLSDKPSNYEYLISKGKIKTDYLNVRGFKLYGDGALGSRGACLLEPYEDRPGHYGFLLSSPAHFDSAASLIFRHGFQMCTHAIGDSGNRTILNVYAKYLEGKNDLRWRIEHAQVVNQSDFDLFGRYNIVPSVQPTHATSDMYWAAKRIGKKREEGAYANKSLMQQNGWLPLGTDFPVEDISPFKTFLAAVFRVDSEGWPAGGYRTEEALTRIQALRGMTIWAARAAFEENEKGSLEKGKFADFIILDKDLMEVKQEDLLNTKVVATFSGGRKVYGD